MSKDKKKTKCEEIVRLQDAVYRATKSMSMEEALSDPSYVGKVDQYLTFLMNFVGSASFKWTDEQKQRVFQLCEQTNNIRSVTALMKIPEDLIAPVSVKEMLTGDVDGPWLYGIGLGSMVSFMDKYSWLKQ